MTKHPLHLLAIVLLSLGLWPQVSYAACHWLPGYSSVENVTLTLPSTITVDPNLPTGSILAASVLTEPNPDTSIIVCVLHTPYGVENVIGSQPSDTSTTIFPTNVSGIGYKILHPDSSNILGPYGYARTTWLYGHRLKTEAAVQLVKTGTVGTDSTMNAGTLGYLQIGGVRAVNFNLANSVTFVPPTCTVETSSKNMTVTLPTISTAALSQNLGATAGRTAFNIGLVCSTSGKSVYVTMATDNAYAGADGVLAPTTGTGYASNVGVQILDGQSNPISFGKAQSVGTSMTTMTIPYSAQYYVTGTPISSGKVHGTVTFNLSYQ